MLIPTLFMVGRIVLGAYFIFNGINHLRRTDMLTGFAASRGLKSARVLTIVSGVVLLLGGVGIILGLMVRLALLALAVFLVAAAVSIHHYWKIEDPQQKMAEQVNFMKNIALAAALLSMLLIDTPWPWGIL